MIVFGWVDQNPSPQLQEAVDAKARRLTDYRKRNELADQRLLIWCDATMNGGKLRAVTELGVDPAGFKAVFFFT